MSAPGQSWCWERCLTKLDEWKDAPAAALPCSLLCQCGMLQGITHAGPRATPGEEMGTAACAGLHPLRCCHVPRCGLAVRCAGPVLACS